MSLNVNEVLVVITVVAIFIWSPVLPLYLFVRAIERAGDEIE